MRQQYEIAAANVVIRDDAPVALLEAQRAVEKAEAGFASELEPEEVAHLISMASARIEVATVAARAHAAERSVDELRKQRDREDIDRVLAVREPEPTNPVDDLRSMLEQVIASTRQVVPAQAPVLAPVLAPVAAPPVDYRALQDAEHERARMRSEALFRADLVRAEEANARQRVVELQRASSETEREIAELRSASEQERARTARLLSERRSQSGASTRASEAWLTNEKPGPDAPTELNEAGVR